MVQHDNGAEQNNASEQENLPQQENVAEQDDTVEQENVPQQDNAVEKEKKKSKKKLIFITSLCILLIIGCGVLLYFLLNRDEEPSETVPGEAHSILVNADERGNVTVNAESAKPNTIIKVNAESDIFYAVKNLYYICEDTDEQFLIQNNSFVMPNSNVVVFAEYEELVFDTYQKDLGNINYTINENESTVTIKPNANTVLVSIENAENEEEVFLNSPSYINQILFSYLYSNNVITELELNNYNDDYFFNTTLPSGKEETIINFLESQNLDELLNSLPEYYKTEFLINFNALKNQQYEITIPYSSGQHFLVKLENLKDSYSVSENGFEAQVYPNNNIALLTKYIGEDSKVTIPETIKGANLIGIKNDFSIADISQNNSVFNESVTHIVLSNSFKQIPFGALANIQNLTYLEVPSSIKSFKELAISLKNDKLVIKFNSENPPEFLADIRSTYGPIYILVPVGSKEIHLNNPAFQSENISVFEHNQMVVFENCCYLLNNETKTAELCSNLDLSLQSITIPETIEANGEVYTINKILKNVFANLQNLQSVTLPETIVEIQDGAFNGCSSLSQINIPNSLVSIGQKAFLGTNITELSFPSSISSIGYCAFQDCKSLKTVNFPANAKITEFPSLIFAYCTDLETVSFPDGLSVLGGDCFNGCVKLKNFEINDSLTEIGSNAFKDCELLNISEIPTNVKLIGNYAFQNTGIETLEINSSELAISPYAFSNCVNLTSVVINGHITDAKMSIFGGCPLIKYVIFNNPNVPIVAENVFYVDDLPKDFVVYVKDAYFEKYMAYDEQSLSQFWALSGRGVTVKKLSEKPVI